MVEKTDDPGFKWSELETFQVDVRPLYKEMGGQTADGGAAKATFNSGVRMERWLYCVRDRRDGGIAHAPTRELYFSSSRYKKWAKTHPRERVSNPYGGAVLPLRNGYKSLKGKDAGLIKQAATTAPEPAQYVPYRTDKVTVQDPEGCATDLRPGVCALPFHLHLVPFQPFSLPFAGYACARLRQQLGGPRGGAASD